MKSVFKMMNYVFKMMDFVFKMMKYVFKMMNSVFKMMNFVFKSDEFCICTGAKRREQLLRYLAQCVLPERGPQGQFYI